MKNKLKASWMQATSFGGVALTVRLRTTELPSRQSRGSQRQLFMSCWATSAC